MFGTVQQVVTCPDCHGSGKIIKEKCPDCRGEGYIATEKNIELTIPAGIDDGQTLRRSGGGDPGTNGGPRGDLLVDVAVSQHPFFKRQGLNCGLPSTLLPDLPSSEYSPTIDIS